MLPQVYRAIALLLNWALVADVISVCPSLPKEEFLSAASDSIVGRKVEVTLTRRVDKFPLPVIVHLIEEDQNRNKKRTNVARMFKQMG